MEKWEKDYREYLEQEMPSGDYHVMNGDKVVEVRNKQGMIDLHIFFFKRVKAIDLSLFN